MRCRLFGQIALALYVSNGIGVLALPSDPLPEAIRTLEADGKLAEPRQKLDRLTPPLGTEDLKAHLELIDETTNLLGVIGVIFVLRRIWLTKQRSLELVDLSLAAPSPAANRELAQELQDVIDRISGAGPGSAKLDATGAGDSLNEDDAELPPPDLVFVTPPLDAPELAKELDAFVSATPTISVGGIGLNPQQLWTFIKRVVTPRPRHAFTGTLTAYDNTLTLRLMHEDRCSAGSKSGARLHPPRRRRHASPAWWTSLPGSSSTAKRPPRSRATATA
jgi:hypothetical protein